MSDLIRSCVSLDPAAKSYLVEVVKDINCFGYRQTYSSIINDAIVLHAKTNDQTLHLQSPSKMGRPRRESMLKHIQGGEGHDE